MGGGIRNISERSNPKKNKNTSPERPNEINNDICDTNQENTWKRISKMEQYAFKCIRHINDKLWLGKNRNQKNRHYTQNIDNHL